jgi:hypothetical protein
VRGTASSVLRPDGDRRLLLDEAGDLVGRSSNAFDADVGFMASGGLLKAGLTIRNLMEPGFKTNASGTVLRLERQARAGVALTASDAWVIAADVDLLKSTGPAGRIREFAAGAEGRVARKAFVRGGLHVNTLGTRQAAVSGGLSFFLTDSFLVDAQLTGGGEESRRGWGISARFVF